MTPRDFGPPTRHPREHLAALAVHTPAPTGVAFLLGSERFGMRNEDVYKAHVCLQIPTTADFGSLNLGAAVQVLAYEWRLALGGFAPSQPPAAPDTTQPADAASVAGMLKHWEEALVDVGFLDPQAPKKLMPRLQQLFNRAAPTPEEIHILRGIAKSMAHAAQANPQRKR
jgi:tRNA/rRNA methyltransferase